MFLCTSGSNVINSLGHFQTGVSAWLPASRRLASLFFCHWSFLVQSNLFDNTDSLEERQTVFIIEMFILNRKKIYAHHGKCFYDVTVPFMKESVSLAALKRYWQCFTRSTADCGRYVILYFIHMVHGYRRLHASELYYRLLCFLTDIEDIGSLRVNGEFVTMREIDFCGK